MGRRALPRTRIHDLEINMDYWKRHLVPVPGSDCVVWDAGMHRQGYGMVGAWREDGTKIMTTTHRVAARIALDRALDPKEFVVHTCDNPACCNGDHLRVGDRDVIHQVMREKQRYRPRGRDIYSK